MLKSKDRCSKWVIYALILPKCFGIFCLYIFGIFCFAPQRQIVADLNYLTLFHKYFKVNDLSSCFLLSGRPQVAVVVTEVDPEQIEDISTPLTEPQVEPIETVIRE